MKLRQKIILFAVLPLALALCAIALTVRHHAISLAQQEREVIKPAYLATKEAELKNYVALATRAIAHLYGSGRTDAAIKDEAKTILEKLAYGEDGYFFLYDLQGNLLMHPKLKELVGKNMSDLKDDNGKLVIQDLTRLARKGGGFYDYVWPKYSKETGSIPKRAYVIELPTWGWMLGSGVYLDDVDDALSEIDTQVSRNIEDTMLWIAGIAFLSTVAIFLGLMLNIRERTAMDDKLSLANTQLKAQAQRVRDAQDEERERMKNDLHDCVQPMLVAVKMKIETGLATLPEISEAARSQVTFKSAAKLSKETLNELRKIIRGIYPIDPDLNLASKLTKLAMDMSHVTLQIEFVAEEEIHGLTGEEEESLYLIAKIALNNIEEHAAAHQASVRMEATEHYIKLSICDDGGGFDVNRISDHSSHGIGLRNMKKRLESVGGLLTVTSSPNGTCVVATINLPTG